MADLSPEEWISGQRGSTSGLGWTILGNGHERADFWPEMTDYRSERPERGRTNKQ